LKGANKVLNVFREQLGVVPGQTTADKEFHLQEVRCLGCCNLAPVVTVDSKIHAKMDEPMTVALIQQAKAA
jgi:NADH:ubiquinone oxidoreductase subunit E